MAANVNSVKASVRITDIRSSRALNPATSRGFDTLATALSAPEAVADVSADPGQEENAEAHDDEPVPGGALPVSQSARHQFIQEHDRQHQCREKPDERREDREH
jgi:hypothetical protein